MRLLSPMDMVYYRSSLVKLLEMCEPGKEHYTFEFYKCASCFVGDRGVFLRRCLRTLVARGYMDFHRSHFNHQKWSIAPVARISLGCATKKTLPPSLKRLPIR